jgi:hypothetical protein
MAANGGPEGNGNGGGSGRGGPGGTRRLRRGLLAALTVGGAFVALWVRLLPPRVDLQLGRPAPETVVAPRSAMYVDTVRTEEARDEARKGVPDRYSANPSAAPMADGVVADSFALLRQAQREPALSPTDRMQWVKRRLDLTLSDQALSLLLDAQPGTLTRLETTARHLAGKVEERQIRDNTDDLDRARQQAQQEAAKLQMSQDLRQAVGEVVAAAVQPTLLLDVAGSRKARDDAAAAVAPGRASARAGETVIYEGQTVTQHHLDMAQALGLMQPQVDFVQAAALVVLLGLLVLGWAVFLAEFAPSYYAQDKYLFVSAVLAVLSAFIFRLAQGTPWFEAAALATASSAAVALCILTIPLVAVAFGGVLSILVGLMAAGSDARLVIAALMATLCTVGAMGQGFQHTSVIARTAVVAAVADALFLLLGDQVYGLLVNWQLIGVTAAAGFSGAVVAVGLVLAIQRPLGITTDVWLLELGNPHEPVLRRLLTEAPGTYQASLMVATLAEAAAEAIGANALLARVAATYHDIGKLRRPGFFIENQFRGENPHEKLAPQVSAMVLAAHVREGAEMARQLRLPPEVVAAIEQHQGTALMAFFYDRARAAAKPGEEVPESLFRYPGPKPKTREAVLVMLADVVEAAARTLDSYAPEAVRAMVDRVVQGKVDDGQLSDAPVTLAELGVVRAELAAALTSAFHRRIPYPEQIERELAERMQQRRAPLEHRAAAGGGNGPGHDGGPS